MLADGRIRHTICEHAPASSVLAAALSAGMLTLNQDGILKVLQVLTDLQEVRATLRVTWPILDPLAYTEPSMLVKFDSQAGTLTMFGEVAIQLLKLMGHSGTIPSAMLAADLPAAIARLQQELDAGAAAPASSQTEDEPEEGPPAVSLRQRAYPLVELLQRAAAKGADVIWDRA